MLAIVSNSGWKLILAVIALVCFFCLGIAYVINPDRFIRRSAVRKGGEMLRDWNQMGAQLVGLVVAGFAAYVLYVLLREAITRF
ncbi:hypothetical protein GCM10011507_03750 [Edaphobacter acidisoli]|uniref:Uncharacterized protein n=1 Tax=Edaphobacter acidisoli TaxID=2040573 RepID=A0A916RGP0_9BACT|nr:hypothetical protein GCM10011507_03750 [Edaphobacter acidisoli]